MEVSFLLKIIAMEICSCDITVCVCLCVFGGETLDEKPLLLEFQGYMTFIPEGTCRAACS